MNPIRFTDEDLILRRYGELDAERAAALDAALGSDPALAARDAEIAGALAAADAAPAPEAPADLGARTWRAIEPRLAPRRETRWRLPAALAASVALLAIAFQLGRESTDEPAPAATALSAEARVRVLRAGVAQHLEGSQRLLVTVANAAPDASALELERRWARELLAAHRIYRDAAAQQGQRRIAHLLDAFEPVLLELANAPAEPSPEELRAIQRRIDDGDLVFQARSAGRALAPNPGAGGGIQPDEESTL